MSRSRFIDIDGRRYLWRDLVQLHRAQNEPRRCCLQCMRTGAHLANGTLASAIVSRASSSGLSATTAQPGMEFDSESNRMLATPKEPDLRP
jgi:hypothetical protein